MGIFSVWRCHSADHLAPPSVYKEHYKHTREIENSFKMSLDFIASFMHEKHKTTN